MNKKALSLRLAALIPVLLCTSVFGTPNPIKVLILTGQNNHDWKATTPELQQILTRTGLFEVDVTEEPENCTVETFAKYEVLVSNWNTFVKEPKDWPAATRLAFLDFVRNGGGFVVVHAGGASFPDWAEYQSIIGATWGKGVTGHGPIHSFTVKMTAQDHPITRGIPSFETTDELWHKMLRRPEATILATSFSSPAQKGTGQEEPVAMVTQYGNGRTFNLVLGHDLRAMQKEGFQTLLRRGVEWAAKGEVLESSKRANQP